MDGINQGQCHSIYEQAKEMMKSIAKGNIHRSSI